MKTNLFLSLAAVGTMLLVSGTANAQGTVVVEETTVYDLQSIECKTHYSSSWRDNWFIQLGAGIQSPFTEKDLPDGNSKHHLSPVYNLGFGHWFSPYLGFRISGQYGNKERWDFLQRNKAQVVSANADLMWDMTSSICGVNPERTFSFIPFVGIGGTYVWDYAGHSGNDLKADLSGYRTHQWAIPVSLGLQLRFRLCKYADFFLEGRAQFMGDNFNNYTQGCPVDMNITAIGGFSFTFGGRKFEAYDPCKYVNYINSLNGQINDLRGELAATATALAAAEAQLPCPEITQVTTETVIAPMLSTVRFKINSDAISEQEMVNVYNVAQYMKQNPGSTVTICGYADEDTGTSEYNMALSERRAAAVCKALESYGIKADRLQTKAYGSDTQPYSENDWNRIVIFTQP